MAKRVKNTALKVNESSTAGMSAISGDWVTDTASTASELQYLSYLEKRFQLGLITKEDVQALSRADSAEEKLVIKLLKRLNQFSPYSSEWAQITSIFGTKDRLQIAKTLAHKYTQSAALKLVLSNVTGVGGDQLPNIGLDEVTEDIGRQQAAVANPMLAAVLGE